MDLADAYVAWKASAMTNPISLSDALPLDGGNISTPQPSYPFSLGSTPDPLSS